MQAAARRATRWLLAAPHSGDYAARLGATTGARLLGRTAGLGVTVICDSEVLSAIVRSGIDMCRGT